MSKTTKHIVLEDNAFDYSDVLVASDGYLWVAGKRYLPFANILPTPYTKNIAYSAGTAPVYQVTLGATANDLAGNSVTYTLHITETAPYTGEVTTYRKSYKTAATGSPDSEDVMTGLDAAYGSTFGITRSTHILELTGTVAGGVIDAWISCDSVDGLSATVASGTNHVCGKGTALEVGHFADTLGLTFTGSAYNRIIIKGTDSSGENLNSPVNQVQEFHFWILDSTMDNLYDEFVNVLQADSAYTLYGELIAKI